MAKKITIENLAIMVKQGFDQTATKEDVETIRKEMATKEELRVLDKKVEDGFRNVYARLDTIQDEISDLPAVREELRDLDVRVEKLEHKVAHMK